jgi:hypothetical protein
MELQAILDELEEEELKKEEERILYKQLKACN